MILSTRFSFRPFCFSRTNTLYVRAYVLQVEFIYTVHILHVRAYGLGSLPSPVLHITYTIVVSQFSTRGNEIQYEFCCTKGFRRMCVLIIVHHIGEKSFPQRQIEVKIHHRRN